MVCRCAHVVLGLSCYYFLSTFSTFFDLVSFFSGSITIRKDTLWAQLLLEFSTGHFETMHTCSTWSVDVHVVLGLSSHYFILSAFTTFLTEFFLCSISIRIDILWAQLLEISIDHFETMHTYFTKSEDVHAVLRLFSHYLFINFFPLFRLRCFQV